MDLNFLAEADAITLKFEKAKRALEQAKLELDSAKKNYDDILARADDVGIPKAKLKRLTEERVQALFDIGLLDFNEGRPTVAKEAKEAKPKKPKKAARADDDDEIAEVLSDDDFAKMEAEAEAANA